jgi:hypothetical protein
VTRDDRDDPSRVGSVFSRGRLTVLADVPLAPDLLQLFADVTRPGKTVALRSMMAEAQSDEKFAAQFDAFIAGRCDLMRGNLQRGAERGEIDPSADLDVAIDFVFGVYRYRMLIGHLPLGLPLATTITELRRH